MEFTAVVGGKNYRISPLGKNLFMVTGTESEYILYKGRNWQCADEITIALLLKLGAVIDEKLQLVS